MKKLLKLTVICMTIALSANLFPCSIYATDNSSLITIYPSQYEQVYADNQQATVSRDAVVAGSHWWFGVYRLDGTGIIPRKYTHITSQDGYYIVSDKSGSGVYTSDGTLLLSTEFDDITVDSEKSIAFVQQGSQYGLYSLSERKWTMPLQKAEYAFYLTDSHVVYLDGRYFSSDGNALTGTADTADPVTQELMRFQSDKLEGIRDFSGKTVIPAIYDRIDSLSYDSDIFAVKKDGKWGLIDRTGNKICSTEYDGYSIQHSGVLLYKQKGEKRDYYFPDGSLLIADVDSVAEWLENAVEIVKDGKYGVIDKNGNEVLPCRYDTAMGGYLYSHFIVLCRYAATDKSTVSMQNYAAVNEDAEVIIPEGRYDTLQLSNAHTETDEAIWCINDGKLCAIYNAAGLKISTNQLSVDKTAGFDYWDSLHMYKAGSSIYTADGRCILQAESICSGSDNGMIFIKQNGKWQVARLQGYADTSSSWAAPEISSANNAGILPDYLKTSWRAPLSREDFCVLIMKALENSNIKLNSAAEATPFKDIDNSAVTAAYELGIVNGVGNNLFSPDRSITREEAAKMLWNAAKLLQYKSGDASIYTDDSQISSWSRDAVYAVASIETTTYPIMQGTGNNMFSPKETYTREQAVASIYRLYIG